jgi:hypothetical protein
MHLQFSVCGQLRVTEEMRPRLTVRVDLQEKTRPHYVRRLATCDRDTTVLCVAPSLTIPCGKTNFAYWGMCFASFNFSIGAQVVHLFELTQQTVKNPIRD